jgi:hypothetical protein
MCHNEPKVGSKFEKPHFSRLSRPLYSLDISGCDFWVFVILKGILKDHKFQSNDDLEEAIAPKWNHLTFDDMQSVFHNQMNPLAWVIEKSGEYTLE